MFLNFSILLLKITDLFWKQRGGGQAFPPVVQRAI
jgi:hypothetical protein